MEKRHSLIMGVASCVLVGAGALAQQPVVPPGFNVYPFAGPAAGGPPIWSPKFGVIDMPGGAHGGMMYIAELGMPQGQDIVMITPNGMVVPYSVPKFGAGCLGIDIDGPTADKGMIPTLGLYGGPPMMFAAVGGGGGVGPFVDRVMPGGPWAPFAISPAAPGPAQLQFDRTPQFMYGGFMYTSDWGGDPTDGILMVNPVGVTVPFAPLPGLDPRYFTFDYAVGAAGYGPGRLWVSSFTTGQILSILPNGMPMPPLAVLAPGIEGLAFGPGDLYFGPWLYVANLPMGTIDQVMPNGVVVPFAAGFPGAAYPMFVTVGPFARFNKPTLYLADGGGSIWMILHCPPDFDNNSVLNINDFIAFQTGFALADPRADFNGDGVMNIMDFIAFQTAYALACP